MRVAVITHRESDHAPDPRQHPAQIRPFFRCFSQPSHFGMTPLGQGPLEVWGGGWRLGRGHSAGVEAQLNGLLYEGGFEPGLGRGPGAHRPSMRRSTL